MAVKTDITLNMAANLLAKPKEAVVNSSLAETVEGRAVVQEAAPASPASSSGDRGLKRLPIGNKDAQVEQDSGTTETSSTEAANTQATTDTSTVQSYQTVNQLMFALLSQVSANLCISQNLMAEILQLESEQAQSVSELAQTNQTNLTAQLDEQAKRAQKMRFVGWAVKGLVIAIALASVVASGGLSAAPVSALLMLALTSLTVAKPDLLNNKVIEPIASGLEKEPFNMPPKAANLVASVIVMAVIVGMTAGAGAADAGLVARSGVDYGKIFVGELATNTAFAAGITNPYAELFQIILPNHPMAAELAGTALTIGLSLGAGIAGASQIASSGALNSAIKDVDAAFYVKYALAAMNLVKGGAEGTQGWMTIEQGITQKDISESQAAITQNKASLDNSQGFSQSTQSLMKLITQSLGELAEATYSLGQPGQAAARSA